MNQKDTSELEIAARQALRSEPNDPQALSSLGIALFFQSKYPEAEAVYVRMTDLDPSNAMYWMNLGTARRCNNRIDEALYAFARASSLGASTAEFYFNVALAHIDGADYEAAHFLLSKALSLKPEDAELRYQYALCCYETLRTDEALSALEGWENLSQITPGLSASAGHLLMKLGEIERAEPIVRHACAQAGADLATRLVLVKFLERTNQTAEARNVLNELLASVPEPQWSEEMKLAEARVAQHEGLHARALALFTEFVDRSAQTHQRHFQLFPMAKSLDALERYEDAFKAMCDAHASQLAYFKLKIPGASSSKMPSLSIAEHPCDSQDVSNWDHSRAPSIKESPIFIVGFPRSGTTLLELVLDAHPRLKSMDEQPFLQMAVDEVISQQIRYPSQLSRLSNKQLDAIRSAYWARATARIKLRGEQRLIDKNPLNVLRLPMINRLFPNAKILLATRHPCDVILSCFMQHFRAPDFALLCKDLPTLASAYKQAFDFWFSQQEMVRADVLEVRYESLVLDLHSHARSIFDFLQIEWNDAALSPATRAREKRFISTPSYSQVVKPVNAKAVDRWRNYERHFKPILATLAPYFGRWNYAF